MSGETSSETYTFREEIPIDIDRDIDRRLVTSHHGSARSGFPPLILPIDPLVRPWGLPILVPQNLVAVDMPSYLPKFYGTKYEDPSRHMKRFIERVASSLITNRGYSLVWFHTTLEGEAYE